MCRALQARPAVSCNIHLEILANVLQLEVAMTFRSSLTNTDGFVHSK